jgi:hypothetical protein
LLLIFNIKMKAQSETNPDSNLESLRDIQATPSTLARSTDASPTDFTRVLATDPGSLSKHLDALSIQGSMETQLTKLRTMAVALDASDRKELMAAEHNYSNRLVLWAMQKLSGSKQPS